MDVLGFMCGQAKIVYEQSSSVAQISQSWFNSCSKMQMIIIIVEAK
jgi:hypothetical protein